MKRMLRAVLPLLLCLSLCLILFPCAFAEGGSDTSVRFYNAKGYDLIGLHVYHADGSELTPVDTGDGYRYLLAPGEYTYAYHDSREIFNDIEETSFTVGSAALEIPVTLTASFEENYYSIWNSAPLSEGGVDEATIRFAMPTREEVLDRLTETLLEKAGEDESGFSLSDSDVFDSTPGEISSAALQVRNAMINRQPEVQVSFSSAVKWSQGDIDSAYYDTLSTAVAHTGNHWEGDTIKKVLSSTGGSIGWAYDGSVYNYQITFTLLYKTDYTQETVEDGSDKIITITGMGNYTGGARGIYANPKFDDPDGDGGSGQAAAVYQAKRDLSCPTGINPYIIRKVNPSIGTAVITPLDYIPVDVPVLLLSDAEASGFVASPKDPSTPEVTAQTKNSNLLKVSAGGETVGAAQIYMFYKGEFVLTKAGTLGEGKFYLYNPNYANTSTSGNSGSSEALRNKIQTYGTL